MLSGEVLRGHTPVGASEMHRFGLFDRLVYSRSQASEIRKYRKRLLDLDVREVELQFAALAVRSRGFRNQGPPKANGD
jgi:hypothetical protein